MKDINKIKDSAFLRELDLDNLRNYLVKITILNDKEIPLQTIEGRATGGSITIDGSSSVRRAGNITVIAEGDQNDLTSIDNLFSINKRVKIQIGLENHVDKNYDDIIWFKQGIFLISQPSIAHSVNNVTISLQLKDKMCLLNGELGGNLPTSVTFDSYDQIMGYMEVDSFPIEPLTTFIYKRKGDSKYYVWEPNKGWTESSYDLVGKRVNVKQRIFDIIQTAVCNYGGEDIAKIIINDVPLELKQIVRYTGSGTLYFNSKTGVYTMSAAEASSADWVAFDYNQDCGYIFTDFTFPGTLVTSIGDNVCSVLDKIKEKMGNFEYFYDIDGNFVFQEKKNYLNTTYDPVLKPGDLGFTSILNEENFMLDYSNTGETVYSFEEGNGLITSYNNNPNFLNIKNDFHIWGKSQTNNNNGNVIHYHVVIKDKPKVFNKYIVEYEKDKHGDYTGKVILIDELNDEDSFNNEYYFDDDGINFGADEASFMDEVEQAILTKKVSAKFNNTTETLELTYNQPSAGEIYIPEDWRAELYMQGLSKKKRQIRPDIYEQELLDLWDSIYDMRLKQFKTDIVNHPNDLKYWIDYIDPVGGLHDVSVDAIGTKIYSYQQDNVHKIYNTDIPDRIIINMADTALQRSSIMKKCESTGQSFSNVSSAIYSQLSIGTYGYVAQETARELLYQYTDYNASISISSIPIYYLEPNTRISINDNASGIHGDYVIKSINMPIDGKSTMSISATKALKRV